MNFSLTMFFLAVLSVTEARWSSLVRSPEDCLLPGSPGSSRAGFPRYYYNAGQEKCLLFTYGGCGGNGNNFLSETECEQTCRCMKTCPFNYEPVCGTDGETYSNLCSLAIATCKSNGQILLDYEGECD